MNSLINKARKPKFELTLRIIDLNNVPLVVGTSFAKWHLPSSTSAEHRGRTPKCPIKEHKVVWDYTKTLAVRLSMDKTNMLQECLIEFEVIQDYNAGGRGEKITLGRVSINLAEYVDIDGQGLQSPGGLAPGIAGGEDDQEEGVTRRYLMQESKINSTLKIGIAMRQIEGERNYIAPPLKTAAVFGGIAGIMGAEQGDQDDSGYLPSIGRSREAGELQDMYRRSLAASWAAQAGELPADKCIENIFAGGDGWKSKTSQDPIPIPRLMRIAGSQLDSEDEREHESQETDHWSRKLTRRHHHKRNSSGSSSRSMSTITGRSPGPDHGHRFASTTSSSDRAHNSMRSHSRNHSHKIGTPMQSKSNDDLLEDSFDGSGHDTIREGFRHHREVDEFEIRDDLMAWHLPETKV